MDDSKKDLTSQSFTVKEPVRRIDAFLAECIPELSRKKARELCESGQVLVNGNKASGGTALERGDVVQVVGYLGEVRAGEKPAELPKDFSVLYEDEDILAVSKPRKLASVRLRHEDPTTLADCIAAWCAATVAASPDPREAGLVQRLDFYTSGVVLAAKSRAAWEGLRKQLFAERVEKSYLALVERRPIKPRFMVTLPLMQSKDGKKMSVVRERSAKEPVELAAATDVTVVSQFEHGAKWYSVVRARGRRVRRHQIRVHLGESGHPLVGDAMYGAASSLNDALPWAVNDEEGFLLHAQDIRLEHPMSGKEMHFQCTSEYFRRLSKLY